MESQPLLDLVNETSKANYQQGRELSIDESMIGTKARISFLQYLPKQPEKWGVKVWVLADSRNGYIHNFKMYTGKDGDDVSKCLSYSVVMQLLEGRKHKGHYVYIDNFYSSPTLFIDLQKEGTYASGTVCTNHHQFPRELKDSRLGRGEMETVYHKHLTAVHWVDKRDVYVLSTIHQNETVQVSQRCGHSVSSVTCPKIIDDYNKCMGARSGCSQSAYGVL